MSEPQGIKIDITTPPSSELPRLRGEAINSYAILEQALCRLLSAFTGMSDLAAGTIFFKIGNARYRNEALSKLKKQKFGDEYGKFWTSTMKLVGSLDQRRNEIVHWHTIIHVYVSDSGKQRNEIVLQPPNFWAFTPDTRKITCEDLIEFSKKATVLLNAMNLFKLAISRPDDAPQDGPLPEILQQELTYPLPPGHLLGPTDIKP